MAIGDMDDRELQLLWRHRPVLRFDRQYDYRAASVLSIVENRGNLLRRADGEVIATAGGEPRSLSLELLTDYPDGLDPRPDDCLCEAPDFLGDARRMEGQERYAGRLYGRMVEEEDTVWLQYWFWLLYNPKHLFGFGKHEGDWEMVQVGLTPAGEPRLATYAQHDSGEARSWGEVEKVAKEDGEHAVVYVAPLSHASYYNAHAHPYLLGVDHPYGEGPESTYPVERFGTWVAWPGRWGNSDRVIVGRVGNGPRSPAHQDPWESPGAFHRSMRRRRVRALIGRLIHRLGFATFPRSPAISLKLEGGRALVSYRLSRRPGRRSRHLYITVHDGDRVVASRIVRDAPEEAVETIALSSRPARPAAWASTFNRLRQRSDLVSAEPEAP